MRVVIFPYSDSLYYIKLNASSYVFFKIVLVQGNLFIPYSL